ncbi:unnamed protein product [Rotaria sp. Silwood2]|nr:unnamed protein product [Rotaria sp. Silwood2]
MGCGASVHINEIHSTTPDLSLKNNQTLEPVLSKPERPQSQVDNAENFIVVWLDNSIIGLRFARDFLHDRKKVNVLMEITVDNNTEVPLANITELAAFKDEQERLFSMGFVFRIGSFECLSDGIWVIHVWH